jgi:hypothetical protein
MMETFCPCPFVAYDPIGGKYDRDPSTKVPFFAMAARSNPPVFEPAPAFHLSPVVTRYLPARSAVNRLGFTESLCIGVLLESNGVVLNVTIVTV